MSAQVDMPTAPPRGATAASVAPEEIDQDQRLRDLAEIIQSYNTVTEKLQRSHEVLQGEVLRLQEELAGKNAQLQRSKRLAALGEMAAGIAHEIRNPLAAIHLYARMLVEDLGDWREDEPPATVEPQYETAGKIADAVRGLNAIVTDVLSFSREIVPRLSKAEPSQLLSRVIDAHRPAIENGQTEVSVVTDGQDMVCDSELVHRALLNLLRNAVDAMAKQPESSRVIRLESRREVDGEWSLITVRDSGPGIEEAMIDRIFNPFFTTRSTGTGLGLAIVHRIVDAHGGSIRVFNDGGAVFELRFPFAVEQDQASLENNTTSSMPIDAGIFRRSV